MGHRIFLRSLALLLIIRAAHATGHGVQAAAVTLQGMGGGVGSNSMMRTMVGSRPPICAGMCWWCGGRRCVAVQVPITPQQDNKKIPHHHAHGGRGGASSSSALMQKKKAAASYDDRSNYKPLSWRCKCGGP
ncbi:hypothetical protein SEVIR_3G420601v4 [Setaria viridis]|uniref:Epidermal patterning factor-like protein n=1 Tax=Setaria viridis TaxID=4556 RepID=A0A4U6VN98_SETVI|nr:EPIDERMAL PATTERNING FACTOR-like protein 2 [Setaria viridis]TKW29823.1 hypothetical protein SEVIR_3G420601v2 [Setaria viridis]